MNLNMLIGGKAGQGLETMAYILDKTLYRMGYQVFSSKDYMSRIRGGHNFVKIRFGTEKITAPGDRVDILVALNKETIDIHKDKLSREGIVVYENEQEGISNLKVIPAADIAGEINPKGVNTVYIGAVLKLLGLGIESCQQVIKEYFEKEKIIKDNLELLNNGYQKAERYYNFNETELDQKKKEILIDGTAAIALGAITAGVKFYTAYPMSPSTGIMNYLAGKQKEAGIVVEQAESEIGAINMALGASFGGVRAMTGTSGGGFALMAEGMGLAGITETPLVIAEIQRPGPATGLPTRTEQGDLLFVVNVSQGEFPLMVISPRDQEDAFYQTFRAFNLADKYQIPVVILGDQFLADSAKTMEEFDFARLSINRYLLSGEEENEEYKRYEITDDGISPRAYPGQIAGGVVLADSDEHNQAGHITESAELRKTMVDKRMKKSNKLIDEDLNEPEYTGESDIDYLLIGWGSTYGPLLEAQKLLTAEGVNTGLLSFADVWPLPRKKLEKWASRDVEMIIVENNATAQFARLLSSETGIIIDRKILKYDGRPFSGEEIYQKIKEVV
ncbi:MAG TPA: 2-oxoacid:acceptor oxidoreductase subunit alpha [Halanaerobiales bacterium]|nr:2-oxoacid:acceptor oxidoreductase subunit alpha [Halanaerobiales bacterium]